MGTQQTKPGAARVESAIHVEEAVAAAGVVALGAGGDEGAVIVLVGDVEELVVGEAVGAARGEVGLNVVESAEEAAEGDVPGVVEVGAAEDEDAVLGGGCG